VTEIIYLIWFLIGFQVFKDVLDFFLMRANLKNQKLRDECDNLRWKVVVEKLSNLEEEIGSVNLNLHYLQEDVFDIILKNAVEKKGRGPYGPRKKKQIEHKKTPPEN